MVTYDDLGRTALLVLPDTVLSLTTSTDITFEVVVTEVAFSEDYSNSTMTTNITATFIPMPVAVNDAVLAIIS